MCVILLFDGLVFRGGGGEIKNYLHAHVRTINSEITTSTICSGIIHAQLSHTTSNHVQEIILLKNVYCVKLAKRNIYFRKWIVYD